MVNLFSNKKQNNQEENLKQKIKKEYIPKEKTTIYYVNCKIYSFALYWYLDDLESVYLSNIKVKKKYRNKGYGNLLLNEAFNKAKFLGFKNIYLFCNINSWLSDWYERKGFVWYSKFGKSLHWYKKEL